MFAIALDDEKTTYCLGDTISGRVRFQLNGVVRARAVRICLRGRASAKWIEEDWDSEMVYTAATHSKRKSLLHESLTLWGKPIRNSVLYPGEHEFTFKIVLPTSKLPPSFEQKSPLEDLSIDYWLTAKIVRRWKDDYKIEKSLTIVRYVNIDRVNCSPPIEHSTERRIASRSTFSRQSHSDAVEGRLSVRAHLNRVIYSAVEDSIYLSVQVDNRTIRTFDGLRCRFVAFTTARAGLCASRIFERVLWEFVAEKPIAPSSHYAWLNLRIDVSDVAPSVHGNECDVISLLYCVHLVVPASKVQLLLPVFLASSLPRSCCHGDENDIPSLLRATPPPPYAAAPSPQPPPYSEYGMHDFRAKIVV